MPRTSNRVVVLAAIPTLLLGGAITGDARASTNVGGAITSDTTWTLAGSPYVVTSSLYIGGGATLVIEPGVSVRVEEGLEIVVGAASSGAGTLIARGVIGAPIVFTSAGDASAGAWRRIRFDDLTVDATYGPEGEYLAGSVLQHCVVEYAGGVFNEDHAGAIHANASSPALLDLEVRHHAASGIKANQSAPPIRIVGCTIWDCLSTRHPVDRGGGIHVTGEYDHLISGNEVHHCVASFGGGGICLATTGGVVLGNYIHDNAACVGGGFQLYNGQGSPLTFDGNVVANNVAGVIAPHGDCGASQGGGAHIHGAFFADSVSITNNTITGNTAGSFGGLWINAFSGTVSGNIITKNAAMDAVGGGALLHAFVSVTVVGNTFAENYAKQAGCGVYLNGCQHVTFIDNTVVNNHSTAGTYVGVLHSFGTSASYVGNTISWNSTQTGSIGGLYLQAERAVLVDNTIMSNHAGANAGGIYIEGSGAMLQGNNISGNSAGNRGGGIYVNAPGLSLAGDPTAGTYNTIADNSAGQGAALYNNVAFQPGGLGDVQASYVCWGSDDPETVQALVFDHLDDAAKGVVVTAPLASCDARPLLGDMNGDGAVDGGDLGLLLGFWGGPGGDLDGDRTTDGADLGLLLGSWTG